jgi:hypothetical protein
MGSPSDHAIGVAVQAEIGDMEWVVFERLRRRLLSGLNIFVFNIRCLGNFVLELVVRQGFVAP